MKNINQYKHDARIYAENITDNRSSAYYASLFNLINSLELNAKTFHKYLRNKLVHGYFNVKAEDLKNFCQNVDNFFNNEAPAKNHALFVTLRDHNSPQSAQAERLQSIQMQTFNFNVQVNLIDELKKSYIRELIQFAEDMQLFIKDLNNSENYEAALCCLGLLGEAVNQINSFGKNEALWSDLIGKCDDNTDKAGILKFSYTHEDRNKIFHKEEKPTKKDLTDYAGALNALIRGLKAIESDLSKTNITPASPFSGQPSPQAPQTITTYQPMAAGTFTPYGQQYFPAIQYNNMMPYPQFSGSTFFPCGQPYQQVPQMITTYPPVLTGTSTNYGLPYPFVSQTATSYPPTPVGEFQPYIPPTQPSYAIHKPIHPQIGEILIAEKEKNRNLNKKFEHTENTAKGGALRFFSKPPQKGKPAEAKKEKASETAKKPQSNVKITASAGTKRKIESHKEKKEIEQNKDSDSKKIRLADDQKEAEKAPTNFSKK